MCVCVCVFFTAEKERYDKDESDDRDERRGKDGRGVAPDRHIARVSVSFVRDGIPHSGAWPASAPL